MNKNNKQIKSVELQKEIKKHSLPKNVGVYSTQEKQVPIGNASIVSPKFYFDAPAKGKMVLTKKTSFIQRNEQNEILSELIILMKRNQKNIASQASGDIKNIFFF